MSAHPDSDPRPEDGVEHVRCLIPERAEYNGPVSRRLIRRTLAGLGAVWTLASLPLLLRAPAPLRAAGLGLMVPGGGYLYAGRPGRAATSLGASGVAFLSWVTVGNVVVLPLVWVGTAALSAIGLARRGRAR